MIESAMQQYRASLGTVGETPVRRAYAARMAGVWLRSIDGPYQRQGTRAKDTQTQQGAQPSL